jgi:hypothetical protein
MYTSLRAAAVSGFLSGGTIANLPDVNQNSDFNSLQSSSCSSCEVQADKSAYWTPQLYYAHANGTFDEVPNYGMTVYYVGKWPPTLFHTRTYHWRRTRRRLFEYSTIPTRI